MASRPYKNPRIQFVPSDAVQAVVRELAELAGQSRASIVSELLDDMAPVLQGQVEAFRKIVSKPDQVRSLVESYASRSIADIGQAVLEFKAVDGRTSEGMKAKRKSKR